jgi:deazaflavin-dependent oxidoreductase (nitroreductase family)
VGRVRDGWLWLIKHSLNHATLRLARSGRGPISIVRHVGRRSGATYETPIIVAPVPAGFVAELTYGPQVHWYRNVVAAGSCDLIVHGTPHRIIAIETIGAVEGRRAFGFPARLVLTLLRRQDFRLLRES